MLHVRGKNTVLMYFLNKVTLNDVIYVQKKILALPRLFILQFISNKKKALTLFLEIKVTIALPFTILTRKIIKVLYS